MRTYIHMGNMGSMYRTPLQEVVHTLNVHMCTLVHIVHIPWLPHILRHDALDVCVVRRSHMWGTVPRGYHVLPLPHSIRAVLRDTLRVWILHHVL